MRIYSVKGPDGRIYDFKGPDDLSEEDVLATAQQQIANLPKPKTGLGAALGKGAESMISSAQTAFGALTGSPEEAARQAEQRQDALSQKYADQVSLDKVKEVYEKRGLLPAAGEVLSQIPIAIAEQAPQLATMFGGARAGAALGSLAGPAGTVVGGLAGAALPSLVQQFGGNIERQAQEQTERGEPLSIDTGAAGMAALPQAGLDVAGSFIPFGGKLVSKLTGIPLGAFLGKSVAQAEKVANERLLTTLAKGTATGALAEIPTEITQQMLERAQAGLSLSDADAMQEYGRTAYQVGLLAPLGIVGRLSEKSEARQRLAQEAEGNAPPPVEVTPPEIPPTAPLITPPALALSAPQEALRLGYEQGIKEPEQYRAPITEVPYTAPTEAPDLYVAMEQHGLLSKKLEELKQQYATAAEKQDTDELRLLTPQVQELHSVVTDSAAQIEKLGGTTVTPEELETKHQAALSNLDSKIASTHKKLIEATNNTDFESVNKHAQALDTLKDQRDQQLQGYTKRLTALKGKDTARGETIGLFTEQEAPVPKTPQAPVTKYLQEQGLERVQGREFVKTQLTPEQVTALEAPAAPVADTGPTTDEVKRKLAIQTAEHIGGQIAQLKAETDNLVSRRYLGDSGAPNPYVTNKFAQMNELQRQFDTLTEQYSQTQPKMKALDLFDPTNMLQTAVQNGDIDAINRLTQQRKQQDLMDRNKRRETEKAENDRLIASLDERLGLGGEDLATKTGEPLSSVKSTRISEGPAYDALVADIQSIKDKVEKVQGNAKYSIRDRLDVIAAEHEQKKAVYTNPKSTSRQKTGALRRMNTLVNEFNGIVEKDLEPAIKKIQDLHTQFRKIEPVKKVSEVKAEKAALSRVEGKDIRMSPEARQAKRINEGRIAPEIENSKAAKEIAIELGRQMPEYQKQLDEVRRRLQALKEKYGPDDKQVEIYKQNATKQLGENALKLGRTTPEYITSLKEVVAALQESYESAGKQEIKSKRTQQVTRRTNTAPREQSGILSRSAKQELRQRQQNLVKDFTEGMQSEKPSIGMRSDIQGYIERSKLSRGVEVESPDLTTEQVKHIDNNDIQAAFTSIANDPKASPLNRAVAQRLASVLDKTNVRAEDNLTDNGDEILGKAISTEVVLNRQSGMNQEVLLHEGTHAAVERIVQLYKDDPSKLTETQRIAMRELEALYASVKNDPSITSANAKSSLSEFAAEILSNRNLQEQLRSKKWKMSDAWQGVKSIILRLLGFSKAETETMLGAGIQAVDALMVPSSVRGLNRGVEKAISGVQNVPYSNAQKDIAALHTGSNSMKQFSEAFGVDIKQKDRTPEDVERIAEDYLESVVTSPEDHVAVPYTGNNLLKQDESTLTQEQKDDVAKLKALMVRLEEISRPRRGQAPVLREQDEKEKIKKAINEQDLKMTSLDYRVRMSDGKELNFDDPLHYVEATGVDVVTIQAQEDPGLRIREVKAITEKRTGDLKSLVYELNISKDFTAAERALVAKAAGKYSVTSDNSGRLKIVNISPNNRHNVAVVSSADAAFVIQKLREGFPLKQAFLEGMQENADRNVAINKALNKNGWQKFDQVPKGQESYAAAEELNAACAGTPWCTGASKTHAKAQIEGGDFYVYYKDGKPQVAVRMDGQGKIGEVRGNSPQQSLTAEQQKIATDFLTSKNFENSTRYTAEFDRKARLIDIARGKTDVPIKESFFNGILEREGGYSAVGPYELVINNKTSDFKRLFKFSAIDGYGGRPEPSDSVKTFFADKFGDVIKQQFEQNNFVGVSASFPQEYVGGKRVNKPFELLFAGKTYTVDPETVKGLGTYNVHDDTPGLLKLEKVGQLYFFSGKEHSFPALKQIDNLVTNMDIDMSLNLAAGANISKLSASTIQKGKGELTLHGVETIGSLNLTTTQGHLDVKAPDVLYAPEAELIEFEEYRVSTTINRALEKSKASNKEVVQILREFIGLLPEKFRENARREFRVEHPDPSSSTTLDLANTVMRSIESDNPTQEQILAIHKLVNDVFNLDGGNRLTEVQGKLEAPKLLSDTPPVKRLTEAPEAPRFAKVGVGKDKDGNSFFRTRTETTSLGSSFIAQETSAKDKFLGNVMGLTGRVQFVDQYAALSEAMKKGVEKNVLNSLEAQNAEYFLRFGQNRSQLAGQALTNGNIQIREGKGGGYIYESVKGANMMDAAVALEKGKFKNDTEAEAVLTAYVAGLRADVVGWEKLSYENPAKVKQEHAQIMAMLRANPEKMNAVKEAARIYKEYNDGLLDFVAQSGYLSKEKVAELKRTPYIPFYRVNSNNNVELMIDKEHAIRIGNIKDEPQLHALVGDNKQIMPIFTSAVQNTFMLTDMALRNKSVQESAFLLHKMGIASVVSKGVGPTSADTIRFHVKGVPHFALINKDVYGIPADLIVKGMEGIKTSMPAIVQMMGVPANLLRNFIVRNPAYALRQVIRDPMTAWLTTGTDAIPILSSMRELASMVAGRSETENTLMQAGAISSNVFTGDQRDMSKFLKEISTGKSGWSKLMAKADAFALQGDAATRAVVYKDSLDKGMSEQAALLRTLESMNFGRRGVSPSVQWLNTMIPFFNAQIQGLDVLYRAFKGDMPYSEQLKVREKLVARGVMLAAGTLAYAAMMQDDEAYKRAKPEERYGNWFVYVPGSKEPLKIPVPFELGYLFKSLPEAVFNLAAGDEKAKPAIGGMLTLINQSNPFQLPAAIKPVTEVALGKSFFGGDIESAREKKILPSERVRDTTTEAAKLMAQLTGNEEIRKLTGREGVSAISLDHLIRGYTGSLGIALVQLANPLLNMEMSSDVAKPTKPLSKEPFIGGLFQPVQGRGTLDEAYNQMEYVQQIKGTFDDMVAKGKTAEARSFIQDHIGEMSLVSISGAVQKQLGELAKQERMIRASPTLSTERKDELLEKLDQIKTKIARGSMAVYEKTKDRTDRS